MPATPPVPTPSQVPAAQLPEIQVPTTPGASQVPAIDAGVDAGVDAAPTIDAAPTVDATPTVHAALANAAVATHAAEAVIDVDDPSIVADAEATASAAITSVTAEVAAATPCKTNAAVNKAAQEKDMDVTPLKAASANAAKATLKATPKANKRKPAMTPVISVSDDEIEDDELEVSSSRWTQEEKEELLNFLSENLKNYEFWKTQQKKCAEKITCEVFAGRHMPSGIINQWKVLKDSYVAARNRMKATGEGEVEDIEEMVPNKLSWLIKTCPLYEKIDDVLKRLVLSASKDNSDKK
jgi:hypothetical protein